MIIRIGKIRIGFASIKDKQALRDALENNEIIPAEDMLIRWNKGMLPAEVSVLRTQIMRRWNIVPIVKTDLYPDDADGLDNDLNMDDFEEVEIPSNVIIDSSGSMAPCCSFPYMGERSEPDVDIDIEQTDPKAVIGIIEGSHNMLNGQELSKVLCDLCGTPCGDPAENPGCE